MAEQLEGGRWDAVVGVVKNPLAGNKHKETVGHRC